MFASESFDPVARIGDLVLLIDGASGPAGLFEVQTVEAIPRLGQHGVVLLWTNASPAAAPAGYALDSATAAGAIAAGGNTGPISLAAFALPLGTGKQSFAQLRFRIKGVALAGPVIDDLDILCFHPSAVRRWTLNNTVGGVLNAMDQVQDSGDSIGAPASGANITLPAAFPSRGAWAAANRTELFVFGNQGPAFQVNNNGVLTTGGALGLEAAGFRYSLGQVTGSAGQRRTFMGREVILPEGVAWADVVKLPYAGNPA